MIFTSIPDNYAPVTAPLIYLLDFEEQRSETDVRIVDITHNLTLGVKRLYNVQRAELNIAPYVKRALQFECIEGGTSLSSAEGLYVEIALEIDGLLSESRIYSHYPVIRGHGTLFRTGTKRQSLSRNENDFVVIYAPNGGDILCESYSGDVAIDTIPFAIGPQQALQILKISPADFADNADSIIIRVEIDGVIDFLTYRIEPKPERAKRLVWIASDGTLQTYTFPICCERRCRTDKHIVEAQSGRIVTSSVTEMILVLVSDYETVQEIERLGEILGANSVWLDEGSSYVKVDVLTAESIVRYGGALNSLQIEILATDRKEQLL